MRYIGATPERMRHGKVITKDRGTRLGDVGHVVEEMFPLDWLYASGILGGHDDAEERYRAGDKLRELWFRFNSTGNILSQWSEKPGYKFEGEETASDRAEQRYNQVMRATPPRYHKTIRWVCIELQGSIPINEAFMWEIRDSLDALTGGFYRVEKQI